MIDVNAERQLKKQWHKDALDPLKRAKKVRRLTGKFQEYQTRQAADMVHHGGGDVAADKM